MKKDTDKEIIEMYLRLKNFAKVAESSGISKSYILRRLKKLGYIKPKNFISEQDKIKIINLYKEGFKRGDGKQKKLALEIGRNTQFISRFARSLNLTNPQRLCSEESIEKNSKRLKEWHTKNEHPKGMLGKTHTEEYSKCIGERAKKWWEDASEKQKFERSKKIVESHRKNANFTRSHGSWKSDWRNIGGIEKFYRSRWEANYARYLQLLKEKNEIKDWLHEPQTFWFENILRGSRSYLPDFKIINNDESHYWVEVKGYMDDRSLTKIKRFKKYYPHEKLELIQKEWFKKNSKNLSFIIKDWEFGRDF